jgi:hypothetical protein
LGADWLAASSSAFPCDEALKVTEGVNKPAFGYLWGTFGDDHSCLYRFLEQSAEKPHLVRIHITNEFCRRKGSCEPYEFLGDVSLKELDHLVSKEEGWVLDYYRQWLDHIKQWIAIHGNQNTHVVLSIGLENDFSNGATEVLCKLLKEETPYETANNTNCSASHSGCDYLELHHSKTPSRPCLSSSDGTDISEFGSSYSRREPATAVLEWAKQQAQTCGGVLLWSAKSQGLGLGRTVEPRSRDLQLADGDWRLMNNILLEVQSGL